MSKNVRFKIKNPGVFFATKDGERELKVGEVIDLAGEEVPAYLVGKGEVVGESTGKELVSNDELLTTALAENEALVKSNAELSKQAESAAALKKENEALAAEVSDLKKKLAK